jgi:iron complex transport system substrate-binding protein
MPARCDRCAAIIAALAFVAAAPAGPAALAAVEEADDSGRTVRLEQPAGRIVALAPHLAEMLYAAGAGEQLVATVEYSDHPEAATKLPRVGSSSGLDYEAILALRPDLVVAWRSGNSSAQIERLRKLGLAVFVGEVGRMEDIPRLIDRLGRLAGTEADAKRASAALRSHGRALEARYAHLPTVSVFYQILDRGLVTINGEHVISDVLQLCGGRNVFEAAATLVPRVDIEAVLAVDPDIIVMGGEPGLYRDWVSRWERMAKMKAVRDRQIHLLPADLVHRAGPRLYDGAERLCAVLERARAAQSR